MKIHRGEAWGEVVAPPAGLVDAMSDASAAWLAMVQHAAVRLTGGDLLATLGGPTTGPSVARFPVDGLRVQADGEDLVALAHVVARGRSWWRGPIAAVCNVDHIGHWDVAPRAHPGDGRFDVLEVDAAMSARARWQAWRRLPMGTHVPHPRIRISQGRSVAWVFDPPRTLWVDGERRGLVRSLDVTVEPTSVVVYT